jgi:hypothetical protein
LKSQTRTDPNSFMLFHFLFYTILTLQKYFKKTSLTLFFFSIFSKMSKKRKEKEKSLELTLAWSWLWSWPWNFHFHFVFVFLNMGILTNEKWSLHSFLTTALQQADVVGNILLFFYKKKRKEKKNNNKILPATSACCGAVVRNECWNHFS